MEKKISDKDMKLICILGAVVLLIAAYYLGFNKYNEKTKAVEEEILSLNVTLSDLKDKNAKRSQFESDIESMKAEMSTKMEDFASDVTQSGAILFVRKFEDEGPMEVTNIAFGDMTTFYTKTKSVETDVLDSEGSPTGEKTFVDVPDPNGVSGNLLNVTSTFKTSYEGLKTVLDYINNYKDKTSIDTLKVAFDGDTGELQGTLSYNMYAVTGTDKVYEEDTLSNIVLGTKNPFGDSAGAKKKNKNATEGNASKNNR